MASKMAFPNRMAKAWHDPCEVVDDVRTFRLLYHKLLSVAKPPGQSPYGTDQRCSVGAPDARHETDLDDLEAR